MELLNIQPSPELIEVIQTVGAFILGWLVKLLTPKKNKDKSN